MKKILILILSICSIAGFGQTIMKPNSSNTPANINDAISLPAIAAGTDTYTTTIIGATLSSKHEAYTIEFTNANTGSATLNISNGSNPLGAITLKKYSSGSLVNLSAGDISAGESKRFRYNGTNFVMEGGSGSGGGTSLNGTGYVKMSGTTPSYNATIPNADLTNSVITIAGASTALGSSITLDDITGLSTTGFLKRTGANTLTAGSLVSGDIPNNAANTSGSAGSVGNALSIAAELISGGATTYNGSAAKSIGIQSASVTNSMLAGSIDLTTKVTGTLPVGNGGTGVTANSGASSVVIRDANQNIVANNSTLNSASVTTAAGTTTLTNASSRTEFFTGTTTQTVLLPVTSTLALNWTFEFINNSTGVVTVQSSGANTIQAMEASSMMTCKCISTSGTGTSSWDCRYSQAQPMTTYGDLIYGGDPGTTSVAPLKRLAPGTSGYLLQSNGSGSAPSWVAPGSLSGLTTNGVLVATSSTTAGTVSDLVYGSRSLTVGLSTAGTNTLNMTNSGATGFTLNLSTGEFRMAAQSSHFPTFYSSGSERVRINTTGNMLIGTTTDNSKLTVNGSFATAYVAKTTTYTATGSDYTIDCTSGTFTVTLPTAVGITGRIYVITNSGAGTITIGTTSSQTFANVTATPTTLTMATVGAVMVQSNGANWLQIK